MHQFATFAVNTPAQCAIADYIAEHPEFESELSRFYQAKRDFFVDRLKPSRLELVPARSTFFQVADYSAISDESDIDVAKRWTVEHGIASIPLSVFCEDETTDRRLRFCFAKDDDTLERAAEILCKL